MGVSDAAAWQALLPADGTWLRSRSRFTVRGLRRQLPGLPSGTAAAGRGGPLDAARPVRSADGHHLRSYVALPSWRQPVIVAERDPVLLRYVSDSLLTVPPGVGPVASFALSVGLRLLRLPGSGAVARSVLPRRVVVGRLG
jgi:hypothetical protein